jgi:hypothetical protein
MLPNIWRKHEPSSMAFNAVGAARQFTVANVVSRSTQEAGTRAKGGYASNGFVLFVPRAGGANCLEVCMKNNLAFHFVSEALRDGRPIPANGEWLVHDGPVKICASGLHFSYDAFDALRYAPGNILCLVEVADIVATEKDKGVCRRRKIVARFDAEPILRYFARIQALSVVHLWTECPPDVVLDFLMTGDESLRAAAWAAAGDAAWAARAAAGDAAWAAGDAAWAAAGAAAELAAARDAKLDAAGNEFNSLINAEFSSMGVL